ncbi:MAG: hypothetical protein FJW32_09755 [Acidobacteria bacterium]|nr:hypothetical protein [Acidobacteriota bacterium]
MEITLPPDLSSSVERELASGNYRDRDDLIEQALRQFVEAQERGARRLAALRRIGDAVDNAGLYDRTYIPQE